MLNVEHVVGFHSLLLSSDKVSDFDSISLQG